ncbi:MAG: hypothetical protein Q9163_001693 [Psora crenata]
MGPCFSSPKPARLPKIQNISSPQENLMMAPRPRFGARAAAIRSQECELNKQTLEAAFSLMAQYLSQQHRCLTIIAVGGAVNVMLLQSRHFTHDVDYFGTNLGDDERMLLHNAARYAEQNSQTPLGGEWFNNQTLLCLPPDIHRTVTQEAFQQNEVMYDGVGLKILAAPWNYAMCRKMNRLKLRDNVQPYDLSDAVAYLHYYIQGYGNVPVNQATVKEWCQNYQTEASDSIIKAVNREYRRRYGTDGIIR